MFVSSVRYSYIRARQLEGTYPGDPKEGVWPINSNRILYGWGMVAESEWPYFRKDDFLGPEPPGLDQSAKRRRVRHYQRIRNSSEARVLLNRNSRVLSKLERGRTPARLGERLEIKVAFEITPEFVNAPRGLVISPPPDSPILGAHGVPLIGYSRSQDWFEFFNPWGPSWGDKGRGHMPADFFDAWMIDSWAIDLRSAPLPETAGIHELQWEIPDPLGDQLSGFEIYDADADERIGWSFAVHRGEHLDIEELYVKPAYRRRGYGIRLAEMVRKVSQARDLPLRSWIPYADYAETNRPALAIIMLKLGLNLRRSGVRWAAYRAAPSKRTKIVFDQITVPPRPAYARSAFPVTSPASSSSGRSNEIVPYEGKLTEEALADIADALFCDLDAEEAADGPA